MKGTTMTDPVYKGACMCGAVRFEARGEPVRTGMCHCTTCRRNTGSAFTVYAVFPAARLRMLGDETGSYATSEHLTRHFCRVCGSPAFVEERGEMIVPLGAFDGAEAFTPTYELYTVSRLPWLPRVPGLESFERDRD